MSSPWNASNWSLKSLHFIRKVEFSPLKVLYLCQDKKSNVIQEKCSNCSPKDEVQNIQDRVLYYVSNFVSSQPKVKMFLPKFIMRRNYHSYKFFHKIWFLVIVITFLSYFINIFVRWILRKISNPAEYMFRTSFFFRDFKPEKFT